jgi:hypothetical protein
VTTAQQQIELGSTVIFRDHEGIPKAAMVTCTPETYDGSKSRGGNGSAQLPRLENQDELHLQVFSATGSMEVRHNIRRGHGAGQWQPKGSLG